MLKDRGYKVRPVPSGKLALLAAQRDPPDIAFICLLRLCEARCLSLPLGSMDPQWYPFLS